MSDELAALAAAPPLDPVTAATPPVGITSRMILAVAIVAIVGFSAVSIYLLATSADATLVASIEKSWDWAFAMAIGYFLGSSAGSRNKEAAK